jgi:hypothetical protein
MDLTAVRNAFYFENNTNGNNSRLPAASHNGFMIVGGYM